MKRIKIITFAFVIIGTFFNSKLSIGSKKNIRQTGNITGYVSI